MQENIIQKIIEDYNKHDEKFFRIYSKKDLAIKYDLNMQTIISIIENNEDKIDQSLKKRHKSDNYLTISNITDKQIKEIIKDYRKIDKKTKKYVYTLIDLQAKYHILDSALNFITVNYIPKEERRRFLTSFANKNEYYCRKCGKIFENSDKLVKDNRNYLGYKLICKECHNKEYNNYLKKNYNFYYGLLRKNYSTIIDKIKQFIIIMNNEKRVVKITYIIHDIGRIFHVPYSVVREFIRKEIIEYDSRGRITKEIRKL